MPVKKQIDREQTMDIHSENTDFTRICEHCGKEFVLTPFNESAPYAMCDNCYDNYLIENLEQE